MNPEWKMVTMGEILTPEQVEHAVKIIVDNGNDSLATVKALKHYFAQYANEMEAKGITVDYAAHALVAASRQYIAGDPSRN